MEGISAQGSCRDVQVLGVGHLAAAVRVELARRGLRRDGAPIAEALVLACSDFENPASFQATHRLATDAQATVLFAFLEATAQPPRALADQNARKVVDKVALWLAKAQ
jgi:hypothetical protein